MIATGRNNYDHLIAKSNNRINDSIQIIDPPTPIDLDYNNIIDFSSGSKHSVYITGEGEAYGYGDDRTFFIGTKTRQIYEQPVHIRFDNISDKFLSAKCGQIYTVYLTEKGFVIICSEKSVHCVPSIHKFECRIIYISGNYLSPVAIDSRGDFYIFSKNPAKAPRHIHLQEPVYDICRCSMYVQSTTNSEIHQPNFPKIHTIRSHLPPINNHKEINNNNEYKLKISFTAVVTVNGKVFANGTLNNNLADFNEVYSLHGVQVKKIFGYSGHCIALSDDGRVFTVGDNSCGQLGDGTKDDRFEFVCLNDLNFDLSKEVAVSAAVGGSHSLVVTESGKVFGFGSNDKNQLFTLENKSDVLLPSEINLDRYKENGNQKVTFVWCGNSSSVALLGLKPPIHLGFEHFFGGRESLALQLRKISSTNIEYLEKQIKQLKQDVQDERNKNQKLIEENMKLHSDKQTNKNSQFLTINHQSNLNDKMKKRMEMKLCDIFNENDKLEESNALKSQEIEELKKENEKLRVENEILKNEIKKSISLNEFEKESNFRANENAKLRKELEEKNVKIAHLLNEKNLVITQPQVPHLNRNPSRHINRSHSSTKDHVLIKKPILPNKK